MLCCACRGSGVAIGRSRSGVSVRLWRASCTCAWAPRAACLRIWRGEEPTSSSVAAIARQHAAAAVASGSDLKVLGIESSCDDTGAAVVDGSGTVLSEHVVSQNEVHVRYGGVVPNLAQEAHAAAIDGAVDRVLRQASLTPEALSAVAVTVGVRKAWQMAQEFQLPLVSVHHMEAHALVARMCHKTHVPFPFLCLLVSGGHNLVVMVNGVGQYVQLGCTLDDALGEAYDKVARMLGLPCDPNYGTALERLAKHGDHNRFKFAVPMRKHSNCNFSYAGLKTALRLAIDAEVNAPGLRKEAQVRADLAACFQKTAVQHLIERTRRGIGWAKEMEPGLRHLVVAGGVASNNFIRSELMSVAQETGLALVVPPPKWCTDNGVMVAWAGIERFKIGVMEPPPGVDWDRLDGWVDLKPRWPLTTDHHPSSLQDTRSVRKQRLHLSLTDLTRKSELPPTRTPLNA